MRVPFRKMFALLLKALRCCTCHSAALKLTDLKMMDPNLRKSSVFCGLLHPPIQDIEIRDRKGTPKNFTCATKFLPNFRVNFVVRFVSNPPLFYCAVPSNCSVGAVRAMFWLWPFGVPFWPLKKVRDRDRGGQISET